MPASRSEIVPTAYRATVSGLRYTVGVLSGAVSLALEGVFYDLLRFDTGTAVLVGLWRRSPVLVAVLFCRNRRAKRWRR